MSPEAITAIVTGLVALVGSITALITSKISAGNSATKVELEDLRRRVDDLKNELQIKMGTAPASASATGTAGTVIIAADGIYLCTDTDTWVKAALATWP